MMKKILIITTLLLIFYSCDNEQEEEDTDIVIILEFEEPEEEQSSRAIPEGLSFNLMEVWVTSRYGDVITSGVNKNEPVVSSSTNLSIISLPLYSIVKIITRVEYDEDRIYMGYITVYVTEYMGTVSIKLFETPTTSNIESFNEFDEYIQNNF